MCPGCMTAAALQELGPNPAATLLALVARSLPRRRRAQPSTDADTAKHQASKPACPNQTHGG